MGNVQAPDRTSDVIRSQLQKQKQLITWPQFLEQIREMNRRCQQMNTTNSKEYLCFALDKNAVNAPLWKKHVKIRCCKVNSDTMKLIASKELSFDEFMNVYMVQKAIATKPNSQMTTSTFIFRENGDNEGLCCICMEKPNDVLLPCLHSFCLVCVSNEMEFRPQFSCPVCKMRIEHPLEDSWEVPDAPEQDEVASYLNNLTR